MQNNTIRKNEYCHSSSKSMKQEDEELFQLNTIQRITETRNWILKECEDQSFN